MDTLGNPRRKEEVRKVIEQAAEWFTLFEEDAGSAQQREAFAKWIAESPLHVRAFLNVSAVDRMVETADPERELDILTTGPQAAAAHVQTLQEKPVGLFAARRQFNFGRRRLWLSSLAASLALLAVLAWYFFAEPGQRETYATGTGEQRSIALNDGSLVHLNAKSHLMVRYSLQARELHLLEGEALFSVEHDATKPFRVHIGRSIVQAIGTQFDIDRRRDRTTVSVLEGAVQVSADQTQTVTGSAPVKLTAGQSVDIASDGKIKQPAPANVAQVTAWRERQLVFDEDSLADIATEFNRYNRAPQLRIEGDTVRQRRYAAVFDADDPEPLLQFLKKDPELAFETRGNELIIRPRQYESDR